MIVYELGERLVDFDPELAEMLLLGIATDTGFFRYASVDERVFSYAARLVRKGANIGHNTEAVLEHRTLNEIRLTTAMLDTLKLSADGRRQLHESEIGRAHEKRDRGSRGCHCIRVFRLSKKADMEMRERKPL